MFTEVIGAVNVTFNCVIADDMGDQLLTLWNLLNFNGVANEQDLITAYLPVGSVILSGDPAGNLFGSFRNVATFTEFREELDGATLACGTNTDLLDGYFFLRVYRKYMGYIGVCRGAYTYNKCGVGVACGMWAFVM